MSEDRKAGRELDVLVAEKVFGMRFMPLIHTVAREFGAECELLWHDGEIRFAPVYYSTDIADALEIVDELRERGLDGEVGWLAKGHPVGDFWAAFGGHEKAWAETAPLAICIAALNALEAR